MPVDQTRVEEFAGRVVCDMAAAMSGVMVNLGHKLGLYRSLHGAGPTSAAALAAKAGLCERYVHEWLNNQVAGGYLDYDPGSRCYSLSEERAQVLADPTSAAFLAPGFDVVASLWLDEDKVADAFRSGDGIGWHEHHPRLFFGTEALFRPGYRADLVANWIPALEGIDDRLRRGGSVADVGCGHGASSLLMAEAYPASTVRGVDYHPESIAVARQRAVDAGLADRVTFEVADAAEYGGERYDLVCFMDCFHDLGDPRAAARYARSKLAAGGAVMLVEPLAGDAVEDNINPIDQNIICIK